MAEMLSYMESKSKAFVLEDEGEVAFPDENYAREIMQLFTIGVHRLNMDGTRLLDERGLPIPTYDNSDIQNFARAWTGFRRQNRRSNIETYFWDPNRFDPMRVVGPWRDFSPKKGLDGTYIGDTYPLCVDEPDKAFLRKGAKYRLLGSSDTSILHHQNEWYWFHSGRNFKLLDLPQESALFSKLCNGLPGSCNYQAIVTLDSNIGCDSSHPECSVDELRVVQVQSDPPVRYEYIRPPCVNLAFYDNGKTIQRAWPTDGMCANADLPLASDSCCTYPSWGNPGTRSLCSYTAEKTTFATSKQRCEDADELPVGRGVCAWGWFHDPEEVDESGYECHHFGETFWYWAGEDTCKLQAKGMSLERV